LTVLITRYKLDTLVGTPKIQLKSTKASNGYIENCQFHQTTNTCQYPFIINSEPLSKTTCIHERQSKPRVSPSSNKSQSHMNGYQHNKQHQHAVFFFFFFFFFFCVFISSYGGNKTPSIPCIEILQSVYISGSNR
jgi:hypothetical protein